MATAQIKINSISGSNTDLPLNTLVTLSNNDNTGVTTWEWTILSQPAGTPAVTLSSLSASTSTFTPTKEGSYLIRLVVNKGLAGEATNQVVAAVRELETRSRIPAAGETTEVDTDNGWSNAAVSEILQRVTRFTDNGILVGKAGQSLTPLQVVHISDATEIGVLPSQQRTVPSFEVAYANVMGHLYGTLGVYLETVAGSPSASTGDLVRVMSLGPISGVTLGGSGVVGDPVYVDDTGAISLTPGTNSRQIGTIAHVMSPTVYDLWISGLGGASGAPVGPAGGILGYAGSTYPNPNGLSGDIYGEIPVSPYSGQAAVSFVGDDSNSGIGTALSLLSGSATGPSGNGGDIELVAGASNAGVGGAIQLFSGNGITGGEINIYTGVSASGNGAAALFRAGVSTTATGGTLYLQGGPSNSASAGMAGGTVEVFGGSNSNANTLGGAVILTGGTGAVAPGGKLTLGGGIGTTGAISTGSVTLQAQNSINAGMSGGSVSVLAGNGGTAGQAGAISITAGNSTQNSATADGGAVTITAGNNNTLAGQGGNISLTAGAGYTIGTPATGASLVLWGGKAGGGTTEGNVVLTGGAAGGGSVAGGDIQITSGDGLSVSQPPGDVAISVGNNATAAYGNILIGTTGALQNITIGQIGTSALPQRNTIIQSRFVESPQLYPFAGTGNLIVTVPVYAGVIRLTSALGAVDVRGLPSLVTSNITQGTRVLLFNAGPNNVTFNTDSFVAGTALKLGANTRVLSTHGILELIYLADSTNTSYWCEIAFRG